MLDTSSVISLCSAGIVIISMWKANSIIIQNFKESLSEFKTDIRGEISKEKEHAMELARQRMSNIEKDVDEIFPRLRATEDKIKKNCFTVDQMQKTCKAHKREIDA